MTNPILSGSAPPVSLIMCSCSISEPGPLVSSQNELENSSIDFNRNALTLASMVLHISDTSC